MRPRRGSPVLALGIGLGALLGAGCALNFDRYQAVDAGGQSSDASADAWAPADAGSDSEQGSDTGIEASADSPVDSGDGDAGFSGPDCGVVSQACVDQAGVCGLACGVTSEQCQSGCPSNPCKNHCLQAEQTCRHGCEQTCTQCIGSAGCSDNAGCGDAAFAD